VRDDEKEEEVEGRRTNGGDYWLDQLKGGVGHHGH